MPQDTLSTHDYQRFRSYLYENCGIELGAARRPMLEARLGKRLRALGIARFSDYAQGLFGGRLGEREWTLLIDAVTTNKTDFYREPRHFEYLAAKVLPEFAGARRNDLVIWSAGCSTGEEPYTLAMLLHDWTTNRSPLRFHVLATDISTRVLEAAGRGVYPEASAAPLPAVWRRSYFLRSRDRAEARVRVAPEIRALVEFRRLNLMEEEFGLGAPVDVLFCRNVMIYFDRPTQERLVRHFAGVLAAGGYLFLGHSETLPGSGMPLEQAAPTIYRKTR